MYPVCTPLSKGAYARANIGRVLAVTEREGGKHDEDYDYSYRGGHYKIFRLIRPSLEKGK
jgi:hypothetical protein